MINLREKTKIIKSFNLDVLVLEKLEQKAKKEKTSVSNLANFLLGQAVMTDKEYFKELAKYHYIKFQEYIYLRDQAE